MQRLVFGGDTMLGRGVAEVIRQEGPEHPLAEVAPLTHGAETFLVNLECAISEGDVRFSGARKAFYFCADPVAARTLTSAGVDVVTLGNNHALDADYDGLRETFDILRANGIAVAGAGRNLDEASRAARWSVKGATFGLLSYCDHQKNFAAAEDRPGIRFVDIRSGRGSSEVVADVERLARDVDHVIVAMHWQPNWVRTIDPLFRQLARELVEAGARVVWGHSPHHFQGVEWIRDSVVLYSTGDLVDDYAVDAKFRNDRQLLFEVCVDEVVTSVRAHPLELEVGRTRPAAGDARDWIESRFRSACREVGSRVQGSDDWLKVTADAAGRT